MLLTNAHIYLEDTEIPNGWLEIREGKIQAYGDMSCVPDAPAALSCGGKYLLPGFIDQHTHGNVGVEYMHGSKNELKKSARLLAKEGVTSFLPTTAAAPLGQLKRCLENLGRFCKISAEGVPEALGIHLEGPFLEPKYCGAQNPECLLSPSESLMEELYEISGKSIRMITAAPELIQGGGFYKYLEKNGIVLSAGHSGASLAQIEAAIPRGLKCLTHFHNASSPHHHRNPGVVSAGLMFDALYCELIADGGHLHPDTVRLVHKIKGSRRIILITDALMCKGLPDGPYEVDGVSVIKKGAEIRMVQGGALAGSVLSMDRAAANYQAFAGASLRDVVRACSENPARLLGFYGRKGSIAVGKDADLILCGEGLLVEQCFIRGVPALGG